MGKKYDIYVDGKNIGTAEEKTFYGADIERDSSGLYERRLDALRNDFARAKKDAIEYEALQCMHPENRKRYDELLDLARKYNKEAIKHIKVPNFFRRISTISLYAFLACLLFSNGIVRWTEINDATMSYITCGALFGFVIFLIVSKIIGTSKFDEFHQKSEECTKEAEKLLKLHMTEEDLDIYMSRGS